MYAFLLYSPRGPKPWLWSRFSVVLTPWTKTLVLVPLFCCTHPVDQNPGFGPAFLLYSPRGPKPWFCKNDLGVATLFAVIKNIGIESKIMFQSRIVLKLWSFKTKWPWKLAMTL